MEIEIVNISEDGYHPAVSFEGWRVAILNSCEKWLEHNVEKMERHLETDEVFILLCGSASLIIGDDRRAYNMEQGKIYNVKKAVWHWITMTPGSKVLVVENNNTCVQNTEYCKY